MLVKRNNLITNGLTTAFDVTNIDGTFNKARQNKDYVQAYIKIENHKTAVILLITSPGDKDIIIGYLYFYEYNL